MRQVALVVNPAAGHGRARRLTPAISERLSDAGVRVTRTLAHSAEHASAQACADAAGLRRRRPGRGRRRRHGPHRAQRLRAHRRPAGRRPGRHRQRLRPRPGRPRTGAATGVRAGRATDAVAAGDVRTIDLAEVRGDLHRGQLEYVGCVVSTGYDEKVNARANNAPVDLGHLSYVGAVLAEVRSFAPLHYRLDLDGEQREVDAILVAVANSGIFGGGISIAPDYDLADGLLDVVIVHPVALGTLVRLLPHLATGRPFDHPAIERLRVRRAVVDGDGLHGMADGEPLGDVPLTCTAAPGLRCLRGSTPPEAAREHRAAADRPATGPEPGPGVRGVRRGLPVRPRRLPAGRLRPRGGGLRRPRGRADRRRQDGRGGVRGVPRPARGPQVLLHHAHQGAEQPEVPRPRRALRLAPGRAAHRRHLDQRRRPSWS